MAFTQTYFSGEADYAAMRALIVESYALVGPHVYMTIGDLDWWRYTQEDQAAFMPTVALWYHGQDLAGFVWPAPGNADVVVNPRYRIVEAEMLAWAETNCVASPVDGTPAHLTTWSLASDEPRHALLASHGYVRSEEHYIWHQFDLSRGAPMPALPDGYGVRNIAGDAEVEARVAVHRAAFHPSRMTVAKHRAVMQSLTYRPELDLVATAPDGSFAAYCIAWFDPANRIGLFEPVGCHPDHQRRGLATAVMHEGLRRLHGLGARRAHVLAWGAKGGGSKLYPSAGFEVIDRIYGWKRVW